jgi:protein phosphatase 1 regulatory subunit 7
MKPFNRIDNPKTIDKKFVESELKLGKKVILQFVDKSYTDKILADINELCSKFDESLCIRFYGIYSNKFDCKILQKIPGVKCLNIDCLQSAENLQILKELSNLKILSLGIYELQDTEILNADNLKNLTELIVTDTKTKAFNLEYLQQYKKLKSLIIGGHTKNIDAVGELSELEFLSLNSVKKVPVNFINKLKKLKTLNFFLGGRDNLNEIEENEIENLEIVWVRGFNDLSCLTKFPKLKTLKIEDEIQLPKIQFDNIFPDMTDLKIINCKTLEKITGLKNLPKLSSLVVYLTKVDFDNFMLQELPKELKYLGFHTTKTKIDKDIKARLLAKGYDCR